MDAPATRTRARPATHTVRIGDRDVTILLGPPNRLAEPVDTEIAGAALAGEMPPTSVVWAYWLSVVCESMSRDVTRRAADRIAQYTLALDQGVSRWQAERAMTEPAHAIAALAFGRFGFVGLSPDHARKSGRCAPMVVEYASRAETLLDGPAVHVDLFAAGVAGADARGDGGTLLPHGGVIQRLTHFCLTD